MNSYGVNDAAKKLGVTSSTVKKYYLLFEQRNYNFKRDMHGKLIFTDSDINLFNNLVTLKNQPGMGLSLAIEQLIKEKNANLKKDIIFKVEKIEAEVKELKQLVIQLK